MSVSSSFSEKLRRLRALSSTLSSTSHAADTTASTSQSSLPDLSFSPPRGEEDDLGSQSRVIGSLSTTMRTRVDDCIPCDAHSSPQRVLPVRRTWSSDEDGGTRDERTESRREDEQVERVESPPRKVQSGSRPRIPGPAGAIVWSSTVTNSIGNLTDTPRLSPVSSVSARITNRPSTADVLDPLFSEAFVDLSRREYLDLFEYPPTSLRDIRADLPPKVFSLAVCVKRLNELDDDAYVQFVDESGDTIDATLHRNVVKEFPHAIRVTSRLFLKNVTVCLFHPEKPHVVVVLKNICKVLPPLRDFSR